MFKTLLKQIGDYKRDAALTPIFVILEVIMEVIIPMMMAAIIDYGLTGQSLKTVCLIGAAMIVMAGLALFFGVESGRTASSASSGFAMNLRQAMYERIQTFSFSNIDKDGCKNDHCRESDGRAAYEYVYIRYQYPDQPDDGIHDFCDAYYVKGIGRADFGGTDRGAGFI